MSLHKKSQSSLEFLMIFGIGFGIILILAGIFFSYFSEEKISLDKQHIDNIGNEVMQNIEKIYFLGNGNRITLNTNFPEGIINISIIHKNNVTVNGKLTSFDLLSIDITENKRYNNFIFNTNENYIRFNCSGCHHDNINNISYFNDSSMFNVGPKKIRIESKGDFVDISFVR